MNTPYLIGEKVYLRALDRADAPVMQQHINNPEVNRTLTLWRPVTLEGELGWVDRMGASETDVVLGIVVLETKTLIGTTGLMSIDWRVRSGAFGIQIGEPVLWGKGYGTEATRLVVDYAFGRLNLNRVWLYVLRDNLRGIRAYEKVGFQHEGALREGAYREGRYQDLLLMSMLASEWRARRPSA